MPAFIFIDPTAKTVEPLVLPDYENETIRQVVDWRPLGFFRPAPNLLMAIDDLGLMRRTQSFFCLAGYPYPFAGKALVMGMATDGSSACLRAAGDDMLDQLVTNVRASVTFIGGINDLASAITLGKVQQPRNYEMTRNGGRKLIWAWTPECCTEE